MPANSNEIEKRLWDAADELRANSRLKASEYSVPVLGLIFLRYADHKFARADGQIKAERAAPATGRRQRPITPEDYHARGVLYLPDEARFQCLVQLPEGENIGKAINANFFYTVTLPCTLWFLDRGKAGTDRYDKVLFLDARQIYTQVDRAHREFTPAQIEFLADIVRLYRGREPETAQGSAELLREHFPDGVYRDVPGLCKVATRDEIEAQGWSLNTGRYVGVAERAEEDIDFAGRLTELHEELEVLNAEAHELEERISENVTQLLGGHYD